MSNLESTRPGRIEVQAADLREEISRLRDDVRTLTSELSDAWICIGELEERLHDHEQAVPHAAEVTP